MPPPFIRLTTDDFAVLLHRYEWKRKVNAVHVHHTWRPRRSDFRGERSIAAMHEYHTRTNGWSDIAQHITIDPDGYIWTGRNWNQQPASAAGFNGTRAAGPFMFEMIGDFDVGQDRFDGPQRETALRVVALLLDRFELAVEAVRFHHEMSSKTCPGTGIDRLEFLQEVQKRRGAVASDAGRRGRRASGASPFAADEQTAEQARAALSGDLPQQEEAEAAEPAECAGAAAAQPRVLPAPGAEARAPGLSPERLAELRRFVVNSAGGFFSDTGLFSTAEGDVDSIFERHLQQALDDNAEDRPFRIVFYAHGGLVPEDAGLQIAADQIDWWRANGVYPIHFVWETGLLQTIEQLLSPARERGLAARDIFDYTTDRAIEGLAHRLGGPQIWSGMKYSAMRGAQPGGAGHHVVAQLQKFCERNSPRNIELHAVGHSAGAIFHSYFVPAAIEATGKNFTTAALLAPAITVDGFRERLEPLLGGKIDRTTIFTMAQDWERADNCAFVYRKSLLYLIHYALEHRRETPILGLEVSLRGDRRLRHEFGLTVESSAVNAEVVFSKSTATTGWNASTSTSHGGFDNDAPTMEAVLRRVINQPTGALAAEFPGGARGSRSFAPVAALSVLPMEFRQRLESSGSGGLAPSAPFAAPAPSILSGATAGSRRALCIGINAYPTAPLEGCIADATAWMSTLSALGFAQPILLTDAQATRSAIIGALTQLIQVSRAGDVVVMQYSGHGTQLRDVDGDDEDDRDEAICPYDFADGAFIIDDDFARVFAQIPDGVSVTCFFDCCHSGTNTRLAVGVPVLAGAARPRFLRATPQIQASHSRFRAELPAAPFDARRHPDLMRQVVFAACMDREVAYEENQQGDFTRFALPILQRGESMSNDRFHQAVVQAFGNQPRQHPWLDCADAARGAALFGFAGRTEGAGRGIGSPTGSGHGNSAAALLDAIAAVLRGE